MIGRTLGGATVAVDSGHADPRGLSDCRFSAGTLVARLPLAFRFHGTDRHRVRGAGHGVRLDRPGHAGLSADHELHGAADLLFVGSTVSADQSAQGRWPSSPGSIPSPMAWTHCAACSSTLRTSDWRWMFPCSARSPSLSCRWAGICFRGFSCSRNTVRRHGENRQYEAHEKVLEAALALFGERGIDAASMDAIAEKSGVSKATIYKHWQDKDALALEALSLMFGLDEEAPKFDSGDLRQDLVDALTYQPAPERQEMKNRMMPYVMATPPATRVRRAMALARDRTAANPAEKSDQARHRTARNWSAKSIWKPGWRCCSAPCCTGTSSWARNLSLRCRRTWRSKWWTRSGRCTAEMIRSTTWKSVVTAQCGRRGFRDQSPAWASFFLPFLRTAARMATRTSSSLGSSCKSRVQGDDTSHFTHRHSSGSGRFAICTASA